VDKLACSKVKYVGLDIVMRTINRDFGNSKEHKNISAKEGILKKEDRPDLEAFSIKLKHLN
jgi:hypothetical protein